MQIDTTGDLGKRPETKQWQKELAIYNCNKIATENDRVTGNVRVYANLGCLRFTQKSENFGWNVNVKINFVSPKGIF